MKKLFFGILLLVGLAVKGQPIPAMIQDGRAYTDSTIITNGSRNISAVKVNTLYKKIFNVLDSMLKDSTFAGAGLDIDSVFKFGRWQKRLNVTIASNYSDGVSNVDTLFLTTDSILNVGNVNYIKAGTPRFIESGQQFTINTVPAGYKKKYLLYINSSNVLAINPGTQDTAIALPPSVPPGGIAIGYIDVSGNVITTPTAALSSNFFMVGGNNVVGKKAVVGTTNDSDLVIVTANTPRLNVNGITGNVSIGTTVTNSYKLFVPFPASINNIIFDSPDAFSSRVFGSRSGIIYQVNGTTGTNHLFQNQIGNSFGGTSAVMVGIRAYDNGQSGVAGTSLLKMWGNNGVEMFDFKTSGKFGVGMTPVHQVDVTGDAAVTDSVIALKGFWTQTPNGWKWKIQGAASGAIDFIKYTSSGTGYPNPTLSITEKTIAIGSYNSSIVGGISTNNLTLSRGFLLPDATGTGIVSVNNTTGNTAGNIDLSLIKFVQQSSDPTTSDIPAGYSAVYRNSTTGNIYLWANVAGTLVKVQLN